MTDVADALRRLPGVDRMLREKAAEALSERYPRDLVVQAIRDVVADARARVREGDEAPGLSELLDAARLRLERALRPSLRPAINATGVIIQTNLGRAPLSQESLRAVMQIAGGYSNLEYRLEEGVRGSRHEHVSDLLRRITGAEDALAVNNNAAGVLLVLSAFAQGREVIVSRGQAVEIGGGFRIPDVLRQSGAKLVEVGTTNRTYLSDYEQAITPDTALLLHVHPSNFRVEGFVHSTSIQELVELGRRRDILVVDDLGSGTLLDTAQYGLQHEPTVQERVAAGADLVCFSGDKLLGGPQAGLIAGRAKPVQLLKRHPLARAFRIDKMTIAALVATLTHYLAGEALRKVPVWQMIAMPLPEIQRRASTMARRLRSAGLEVELIPGRSTVGGGSLPGETLPTRLVGVSSGPGWPSVVEMAARLRRLEPPVVARIEHDLLLLDPRTVSPEQDRVLVEQVIAAAGGQPAA